MKKILLSFWLVLLSLAAVAQTAATRIYVSGGKVVTASSTGDVTGSYPAATVNVQSVGSQIAVTVDGNRNLLPLSSFLNAGGSPWSTVSADVAAAAFNASLGGGGGGGGGATLLSQLTNDVGYLTSTSPAMTGKQPLLVSGTNLKTVNGLSLLGPGDIVISAGGGGGGSVPAWVPLTDPGYLTQTSGDARYRLKTASVAFGDISGLTFGSGLAFNAGVLTAPGGGGGSTTVTNNLTTSTTGTALDAAQGKILNDSKQATLVSGSTLKTVNGTSLLGSGDITISGGGTSDNALTGVALARRFNGIVIPAFRQTNKFDMNGAAMGSTALAIHPSGGIVSTTAGTAAEGYIRLPQEITGNTVSRTDFLIPWNPADAGASITVGLGDAVNGYSVTIANSGGNVVITKPQGTTSGSPLSTTATLCVSFATANMGVTASVHVLGAPQALANGNIFRVPIYEYAYVTKTGLWSAYFKVNTDASTTTRIAGFLHNNGSWDGDPQGVLLTRTMIMHSSGWPGYNLGTQRENDSYIVIAERPNPSVRVKVSPFLHQNAGTYLDDFSASDGGETVRQLLYNGYVLTSCSGGTGSGNRNTNWWGNEAGLEKTNAVYATLVNNLSNVGLEYPRGFSMGGGNAIKYLVKYGNRIGAVWLSCPALSYTGQDIQTGALKSAIDLAYADLYVSLTAGNADDPNAATGTWRRIAQTGGLPHIGFRTTTRTTVNGAVSNSNQVVATKPDVLDPGDWLYFKYSGQLRQFTHQNNGGALQLDAPVTLLSGEPISVIRTDGRSGYEFSYTSAGAWSGTSTLGQVSFRTSTNVLATQTASSPSNFADVVAQRNRPIHIYVGQGGPTGNDGILDNAPMFGFRDAVNALNPGLVTITVGGGLHLSSTTLSATDTVTLFNAN